MNIVAREVTPSNMCSFQTVNSDIVLHDLFNDGQKGKARRSSKATLFMSAMCYIDGYKLKNVLLTFVKLGQLVLVYEFVE